MAQTKAKVIDGIKERFHLDFDVNNVLLAMDPELWTILTKDDEAVLSLTGGVDRTDGSCTQVPFRAQDAESLLDQASSILDRALGDRNLWASLLERWILLRFELFQSICLDNISDAEEQNKRFDFEADLADGQRQANDDKSKSLKLQLTQIMDLLKALDTTLEPASGNAAEEVIRRGAMVYMQEMFNLNFINQPISANVPPEVQPPWFMKNSHSTADSPAGLASFKMASEQAKAELNRQYKSVNSDSQSVDALTKELAANKQGLESQSIWKDANRGFLRRRAWAAKQALRMKLGQAQQGEALDFLSQANSAKTRYDQAVSDAYERLKAVDAGLQAYYGYPFPDPRSDALPLFLPDNGDTHDQIVAWTRRVAHWLAAFTRRTNSYILPLSLKSLLGDTWSRGNEPGTCSFSLGENFFDDFQRHIRVRGVSAWAVNDQNKFWEVDLSPPIQATVHLESGVKRTITQDPTLCRVSRVMSRRRLAVPEVGAVTAAFTGSPASQWTVTVRDAEDRHTPPPRFPDDIEIDLYLSYLFVPPSP